MNDRNDIPEFPPQLPLPGDDATLVVDPGAEGAALSAPELRRRLGLPEGDDIRDYGELKTIGVGGMGAVFSGREPGLMREVALKMLRPAYRWMPERIGAFIREARTTAQISHPNIVPVYRIGVFEGAGVYFAMKRVRGNTLRAIVAKLAEGDRETRRRYTLRRLLGIFVSACNGVAFAHHRGVVHCDLKPANVMVGDYGEVMVMDWGMAQYRESCAGSGSARVDLGGEAPADRPGTLGGTPAFMAPELLTGKLSEPDELTDVYSLGAILYSILTWRTSPYPADLPPEELTGRIVRSAPTPPGRAAHRDAKVPREIEEIALKAMARDRGKRYSSVRDLLEDVHNYLDGFPVRAYSPNVVYRGVKLLRRRPLIPLALLAAVLTWGGVRIWQDLQGYLSARNLFTLAERSFQEGHTAYLVLRQRWRQAAAPQLADSEAGDHIRAEVERNKLVMIDSYNSALEYLGRVPVSTLRRSPQIMMMYRDIFRNRLSAELMSRDGDAVRDSLAKIRFRWAERFAAAESADRELRRMTKLIDAGNGMLKIKSLSPRWRKVELRDASGATRSFELVPGDWLSLDLPYGDWLATFRDEKGGAITLPLRVNIALVTRFEFAPPPRIEPGYACVTADERIGTDGTTEVKGMFQISRREVTVGEYLKFYLSLDPKERPACRAVLNAGAEPRYLWDEAGNVLPPFSPEHPVVGVTGDAARRYCRYLSQRLGGRKVSLPQVWQWRRAARGVDRRKYPWGDEFRPGIGNVGDRTRAASALRPASEFNGDVSPYGVGNLAGNAREFARPTRLDAEAREFARSAGQDDDLARVVGGSCLLPPSHATIDSIQIRQWSDRGDDIGFRCVIED